MSKYIIIDEGGKASLAERQEDGTYAPLKLDNKTGLLRILEEIANEGSVSEANTESRPTIKQRVERLRLVGYKITDTSLEYPEDADWHRDAEYSGSLIICTASTLEEFVNKAEEHYNGIS